MKASQGNTARTGRAWLYHDDPGGNDAGEILAGGDNNPCLIDESLAPNIGTNESTTVCAISSDEGQTLEVFDSLSVFVVTDNGSFEGATACVLILEEDAPAP